MKFNTTIFLFLIIFAFSCNNDNTIKLSDEELKNLKKSHDDSITVVLDSLYKVKIYVPPLYDKQIFDSTTTNSFFELAKETHGDLKLLINSKLITREIVSIIKNNAEDDADILFLIDKTGSMRDDILNVKNGLNQIIDAIKDFKNIRLGIGLYGDKNVDGAEWYSFKNFDTNYQDAKRFIQDITVTQGGDYPESVYDGFFKSNEQNFWASSNKRMIILIGDAPPLEKPLSDYNLDDVTLKANELNIKMNFYPIVVTPTIDNSVVENYTFSPKKIISTLYPNPSSGNVNINFELDDSYTIEIFNSSGQFILSEKYSGKEWKKDFSNLENGVYILRAISDSKDFETARFIINK